MMVRALVGSCFVASGLLSGCLVVGEATAQPPRLIKDLNATADGRRVDPPTDPLRYPLTASSYPESPRTVGGALYFVAHDGTSRRQRWRYDPNSASALIAPVVLPGVAPVPNPRYLTVSRDGTLVYLTAKKTTAGSEVDSVFMVDSGGNVTELPFDPLPAYAEVDSVAATSYGVEVLAATGPDAASLVHGLWRKDATAKLIRVANAATPPTYVNASHLVQIEGVGTGYPFYAFTAKRNASVRSLFIINPTAATPFREIAVDNPAMLTPFGNQLMLVDVAPFASSSADTLLRVSGPAATTATTIAPFATIRNLVTTNDGGIQRLFFRVGSSETQLYTWDDTKFLKTPKDADGKVPSSIASIVAVDNVVHVLGTLDSVTTLWSHDTASNSLTLIKEFPALNAAGSLAAWKHYGSFRFAFLATTGITLPVPAISVLSTGGGWSTEDILSVAPFAMPDQLTRVGSWLWFSAAHIDRGVEPFHWKHD